MTGGPASDCSSMESCSAGGALNRLALGQRRDRIELVKVSTASSCLGGAFGTAPISRPATRRYPAHSAVTPGAEELSRRLSVAYTRERSSPLAGQTTRLYTLLQSIDAV